MQKDLIFQQLEDIREGFERFARLPFKIKAVAIYGSWAKGTNKPDSDLDLLIISNEIDAKRHKRGSQIASIKEALSLSIPLDILLLTEDECLSNFRNHNPLFLDVAIEGIILLDDTDFLKKLIAETKAYISWRKLQRLDDGWRFPFLYRESTFLSKVSNKDFSIAMLRDGQRDIAIAENIMAMGFYDKAVYHVQQAVEKAVKAVLIAFGEFKKTHFVGESLSKKLAEVDLDDDWKVKLSSIAKISSEIEPETTWSRYPGIDGDNLWIPYEEYTLEDAQERMTKGQAAMKLSDDFIRWWYRINEGVKD